MTVSASLPGLRGTAKPLAIDPPVRAVEKSEQGQTPSFGDILTSLTGEQAPASRPEAGAVSPELVSVLGALERGHEFPSGTQAYSLQVQVGDSALAFEARPVVGITSVILPEHDVDVSVVPDPVVVHAPAVPTSPISADAVPVGPMPDMEPQFVRAVTDARPASAPASLARRPAVPTGVPSFSPGPIQPGAEQGPSRPASERWASQSSTPAERSRPAASESALARTMLFAQLLAAAGEYRVAVRGTQLTQEDRERLIMDIRAALRSFGFADLPVTIATPSGAA